MKKKLLTFTFVLFSFSAVADDVTNALKLGADPFQVKYNFTR